MNPSGWANLPVRRAVEGEVQFPTQEVGHVDTGMGHIKYVACN